MAGHSKFKNIMHRKGAQDQKRAKTFSRLGREISVSVKTGGNDPESNIRLRSAISAAKALNMPKENIERAIKKGDGNDPDSNYEEVRSIFSKSGGNLGEIGSVSFGFRRLGEILLEKKLASEEGLLEFVVENDSNDLESNEDEYIIYTDPSALHELNEKIISEFGQTTSAQLIWKGDTTIQVEKESAEKLFKLLNALEDNEDIQVVSSNFEVSDDILLSLT